MTDANKDKDDLADALSRLASGEAPSAPEGIPSSQVPISPKETKPKRPEAPSISAAIPGPASLPALDHGSSAVGPRGVQPPSPKPIAVAPPKSTTPSKTAKVVRPGAPTLSQPSPTSGAPRDAAPSHADVAQDDDAVIVPAPAPEVFRHRPAPARPKRPPLYQRLAFRRTIIPMLLMMGVALPGCSIWWLMQDQDSPVKSLGWSFPITLVVIGLVSLALAIVNMIQVRHELARHGER